MTLEELNLSVDHLLDRSICLYGETGTGKSSIVTEIMSILAPHIGQVMVISPTDRQNHTYEKCVPRAFIHYSLNTDTLTQVWARQEAMRVAYDRANNMTVLEGLFQKVGNPAAMTAISTIRTKTQELINAERVKGGDITKAVEALQNRSKTSIVKIMKNHISNNVASLMRQQLNEHEQHTLKYLNFNPRLLLIFDDCTVQLLNSNNATILNNLFYQGRHVFITFVIACHTDKTFKPELKKQAFINIFTTPTSALAYFERKSSDFDRKTVEDARESIRASFTPMSPYQKLAYIRMDRKFYRYTATVSDVKFGSPAIREYSEMVCADGQSALSNNPFSRAFL